MNPVLAPTRSHDQRMSALKHANEIRVARAELKRNIRAGSLSILDVLEDPAADVAGMKILSVLVAVPKLGEVKARRILQLLQISERKTLGGISDRQRSVLADYFRDRA